MTELNFKKLADAPILAEVPDGAKVYAEVDGKVYRVAGDNLGGGVPTAVIVEHADYSYTCDSMTFEEACSLIDAHQTVMFLFYSEITKTLEYAKSVKRNSNYLRIIDATEGEYNWESDGISQYVNVP